MKFGFINLEMISNPINITVRNMIMININSHERANVSSPLDIAYIINNIIINPIEIREEALYKVMVNKSSKSRNARAAM